MSTKTRLPRRVGVLTATAAVTAIALAVAGTSDRALAQTVTVDPLANALGFNAFIHGDTSLMGLEAEGPVAIGGDLIIQGSYTVSLNTAGTYVDGDDARPSALVVGCRYDGGRIEPQAALGLTVFLSQVPRRLRSVRSTPAGAP